MMIEEAIELTLPLVRHFEGFLAAPYLCPAGVPTIGYGTTRYPSGIRVTLVDQPISRDEALQLVRQTLPVADVLRLCRGVDTPERLAALIDFTYNLGVGNLRASTLRKRVNAGEWGSVPHELMRWNKARGRVLAGLTARRAAEAAMI
jgi:lysozyme